MMDRILMKLNKLESSSPVFGIIFRQPYNQHDLDVTISTFHRVDSVGDRAFCEPVSCLAKAASVQ